MDPTTEPLCLAFRLPYWPEGQTGLWHPAFPQFGVEERADDHLAELFTWILLGDHVEAHNVWFERGIWANIMVPRYGWPEVPHIAWRCSAAKAAAHALPRALDQAVTALGLSVLKDTEGAKVMKKLAKPRKPRKAERLAWAAQHGDTPHPLVYHESRDLLETLWAYCRQDVLAEEALSHALDDLSPAETAVYLLDQRVNERGFQLDVPAVARALHVITSETERLNTELCTLTGGNPSKATQRAKMQAWFASYGLDLPDTQKATIAEVLEEADTDEDLEAGASVNELDPFAPVTPSSVPDVRRALTILQTLSLSSTAKYQAMERWACPDGRARGGLLYHGASTGRWAGTGIQSQNFPKGCFKESDHPMTAIWADVLACAPVDLATKYDTSVMQVLSHALRGAITASPGKHLFVADYASIEVRVLLWLADDHAHLEMLRAGVDMYVDMASKIYDRPLTKADKAERQLGKVAVLGLGYQLGASKFVDAARLMGGVTIDEEFAQTVVTTYREDYHQVVSLWYDTQDAAIAAVESPGSQERARHVTYVVEDPRFLFAYLPSGRRLVYPFPEVHDRRTPWGAVKPALTFMGVDPRTHKWTRQFTYGGCLVENNTQATARDVMAEALLRAEATGVYLPVLSVHDELICEAHPLLGDVQEFERLLAQVPSWATGCPIAAEAWSGPRYHK